MDTTDSASKVRVPKLQPEEVAGLQDFWSVHESYRPEITAQLLQMANEHPEFKVILQNTQGSLEEQSSSER